MIQTDDLRFQFISHCVDCNCEEMAHKNNKIICQNCGREYVLDKFGILHAFPQKRLCSAPSFYKKEVYVKWLTAWEQMIEDWVIYKNSFFRFFSMSGHRQTKKLITSKLENDIPIVDLGCGRGELFLLFEPRRCIGIDSNLHFLRIVKRRYPDVVAIHGDFYNTPFSTGSLRCAVSLHTLEHLYFIAEAMEELQRIIAKDGYLLFSIPTEGGFGWELGRRLVTGPYLKSKFKLDVKDVMDIEHINDAKRLLKFLEFYFKIEKIIYAPFPFLPILSINASVTGIAKPQRIL